MSHVFIYFSLVIPRVDPLAEPLGAAVLLNVVNGGHLLKRTHSTGPPTRQRLIPRVLTHFEEDIIHGGTSLFLPANYPQNQLAPGGQFVGDEFYFDNQMGGFRLMSAPRARNKRIIRHAHPYLPVVCVFSSLSDVIPTRY